MTMRRHLKFKLLKPNICYYHGQCRFYKVMPRGHNSCFYAGFHYICVNEGVKYSISAIFLFTDEHFALLTVRQSEFRRNWYCLHEVSSVA